jgi:hydrogenase 3 maturation protease
MPDLREQLQHCFRGRLCVMGLGNIDYSDDGFGVYLAASIASRLAGSGNITLAHHVINAGTTPERMIGSVKGKGYDHLLFLDAVDFGGEPGSVLLLNADETAARFPQISTHKMSIGLLARYIKTGEGTDVWLLGVQPGSLKPSQGLSPSVQRTTEMLDDMLCTFWLSMIEGGNTISHSDLVRA